MCLGKIQDPHHRKTAKHERRLCVQLIGEVDELHRQRKTRYAGTSTPLEGPLPSHAILASNRNSSLRKTVKKGNAKEHCHVGLAKYQTAIKKRKGWYQTASKATKDDKQCFFYATLVNPTEKKPTTSARLANIYSPTTKRPTSWTWRTHRGRTSTAIKPPPNGCVTGFNTMQPPGAQKGHPHQDKAWTYTRSRGAVAHIPSTSSLMTTPWKNKELHLLQRLSGKILCWRKLDARSNKQSGDLFQAKRDP